MAKSVLIFGATNQGKVAASILNQNGIMVYGFLANNPDLIGKPFFEASVLGTLDDLKYISLLNNEECYAFIALDEPDAYKALSKRLTTVRKKLEFVNAIHPSVPLKNIKIGQGNCLCAGVQLEPDTLISSHCTLNSNVVIQCGTVLHDFVHVGPGTVIGYDVLIKENVTIGAGVVIEHGLTIGEGSQIPSGAVIHHDIPSFSAIPDVINTH